MQEDVLMVKAAQRNANYHMDQKNDLSLCKADASNQHEDNGYLVALADGQEMQLATVTADNYSGAQRLQPNPDKLLQAGISRKDFVVAGCGLLVEGCSENESRPSPVLLEGKEVDLLQLRAEVLTHGGYEKVTDTSMWSSISESLGFGQNCGAAVKLVYAKYLKSFESNKVMLKNGLHPKDNVDCWAAKSVEESSTGMAERDVIGSGSSISPDSSICNQESNGEIPSKRRRLSYLKEDNALSSSLPEYSVPIATGSNDDFVDMIEWLRRLALNPGDPKRGQGPRGSKQTESWVDDCLTMAIKTRAVLWGRKELIYYGSLSGNTAKQRIPPKVYYKELPKPNTRTLEKLRANQTRAMKCGLHLSGDAMEVQAVRPTWLYQTPSQMFGGQCMDHGLDLSSDYVKSMSEALSIGYLLNNKATRKRIPIGMPFQAQVPPWTGKVLKGKETVFSSVEQSCGSSSSVFDGIHVWPLSGTENMAPDIAGVGRGRPLRCACANPMSFECVRLHVAEAREKLKGELGEAFNSWGFDDMGESVSARWSSKEELAFDLTVKLNLSSLGKNFWDELPAALPLKTTKELVSYYFNVFVVRRRAIENRTMPDSIDSDDDERELLSYGSYNAFERNTRVEYGNLVGMKPNFLTVRQEAPANLLDTATRCAPCPVGKVEGDLTWIERKQ
eukprot:c14126_g1_i1 orf=243-2261(+)